MEEEKRARRMGDVMTEVMGIGCGGDGGGGTVVDLPGSSLCDGSGRVLLLVCVYGKHGADNDANSREQEESK